MTITTPAYKTDDFFNLKDNWIQTNTDELTHYYELGEGVPVLFLHGSGVGVSASVTWWLNLPELSEHMRAIAFDFIGYGETTYPSDTEFGIRQWGKQTIRLMDALNISKAWLVGSSLGGWVSMQLALDYPERVLGVISIGTGGGKRDESKHKKPIPKVSKELMTKGLETQLLNNTDLFENYINARYATALKDEVAGRRPLLLEARDRDRYALPLDLSALNKLSLPVLLMHGINDKVVPLERTMELLNATPTADAHIFSECGHWPHIGKPAEFNSLVVDYLRHHGS